MNSTPENVSKNKISSNTLVDSWITCDSKSYPGLKFYINKFTGIKVWNITETEIALAEKADKNCVEPLGHPIMDQHNEAINPRIYNKQIINNQFSNQLSNLLVNTVPMCSPINIWDNPPIQPQQMQSPQSYTLVPTAIAQVYQQLLPLSNHLQNAVLPISYNPQQFVQNHPTPNRRPSREKYRKRLWYRSNERFHQTSHKKYGHTHSDLRKKLETRNISESFASVVNDQEDLGNKKYSTWNDKNNRNEQDWEETSIKINLTPLKLLTSSVSNSDQWYIVVDTDVILKNYNYLNNMAAADPNCHLLVPHHVMSELRTHVSQSSNVQARRILRFLTQQIDSGLAMLGEEVAGESAFHKSINTCVQIAAQNHHVVFISNNPNKFNYKLNTKNIHAYTMQDIKEILANRLPTSRVISPTLAVKITVPNDIRDRSEARDDNPEITSLRNFDLSTNERNETGVYTQKTLETHSMQSTADVRERSPAEDNIPGTTSQMTFDNTAPAGSGVITDKTFANASLIEQHNETKCDSNQSPNAKGSLKFSDTGSTKSGHRMCIVENAKSDIETPTNNDGNSLSSLSPSSGKVSLDTVRMKRIISMKTLQSSRRKKLEYTQDTSLKSVKLTPKTKANTISLSRSSDISETIMKNTNVTIEETSTSGVISNSESSHSDKVRSPVKYDTKKATFRNVVMFGIACQSMEDVLKTRCDEWVFRFVQIMEEVLRVKLQEKLPSDNKEYPAPRDLQEAARCIIKKFSNNFNVVDAANKLSFILYKTSDADGKIAENIQPADYMEMYSYGVFLVETFQDMNVNCNDKNCKMEKTCKLKELEADSCSCFEVKTASDSLKKLLYDIQNANLETFVDHPTESPNLDYSGQYDYEMETTEETRIPEVTENSFDSNMTYGNLQYDDNVYENNSYNLRSQKRKSQCMNDSDNFPTNLTNSEVPVGIESIFFNSLQLQKNFDTNQSNEQDVTDLNKADNQSPLKNKVLCNETESLITRDEQNQHNLNRSGHEELNDKNMPSQSKIVRTFIPNAEFERKLKAKQNEKEYDDYYSENEEDDIQDEIAVKESENNDKTDIEQNKQFMSFMGRLGRRLGDVFTRAKLLCDEYVSGISQSNDTTRNDIHRQVEIAYFIIGKIYNTLDRISKREAQDKEKNIQMLLKIANVTDYIPDDKTCLEYRYLIVKCKEKAEEFHKTLRRILKMVRG